MKYLYSEETYDVWEEDDGTIMAYCTDDNCDCMGKWVVHEAPYKPE